MTFGTEWGWVLSGKYRREGSGGSGDGRLEKLKDSENPAFKTFKQQNWKILDVLRNLAQQIGRSPAQVALNWLATQPGITSTILGASRLAQPEDNLRSLEFSIPAELRQRLDEVGALAPVHPYVFFESFLQGMIHGNAKVHAWSPVSRSGQPSPNAVRANQSAREQEHSTR